MELAYRKVAVSIRILKMHLFLLALLISSFVYSQKDTLRYDVSVSALTSTGTQLPFWLRSRQYDLNSALPQSSSILLSLQQRMNHPTRLFDYEFKANVLIQNDNKSTGFYFHELYAKARISVFDIILGSREEILGNQDSTLSSGGFLFSQNARPMPKLTIGIERFTAVPFTKGFVEIKGAISHGWFTDNIYTNAELLHHKYAYIKLGGKLPVQLQYGLDHVVEWGGVVPDLGQQPAGFNDFISVFFARSGGKSANISDQINALGNHIVSQSMRLDATVSDFQLGAYWQNLSEDGPIRLIGLGMNAKDGLWGISIRNNKLGFLKGFVYEYLNTTDQSGPYHDKDGIIYGGNDSYFYNGIYQTGWSYFLKTIGTPFILAPIKSEYSNNYYPVNNRVQVHHVGIEGDIVGYKYKFMSSFSSNYGTYSSPYVSAIENTSMLLEVNKRFSKLANIEIGCKVGADFGQLYGNSVGCIFSIRKTGNLFNY